MCGDAPGTHASCCAAASGGSRHDAPCCVAACADRVTDPAFGAILLRIAGRMRRDAAPRAIRETHAVSRRGR
jgi:hypothetical protein